MHDIATVNTYSTLYFVRSSVRNLAAILMLGALIPGFMASAFAQSTDDLFEQHEFVTDISNRQTIVTGFFLDTATAELAVVYIDDSNNPHSKMYGFEGDSWMSLRDDTLSSEIQFVDVANIGGRDRLITYKPGLLSWFDPATATERELLSVTSSFQRPRSDEIPHVDITQDLNGDDMDDLVVPDVDGFWVIVQTSAGTFADPVQIGPAADLSGIYGADGYRYDVWSQSRIHKIDYNHDGRSDLVFWNEDHFEIHSQNELGLFIPESETFTTQVAFDSDHLSSLATGEMTGRVLHSLADLNGDGVADLVVNSLDGRRISEKRSTYEVHFGTATPTGGIEFAQDAGVTFQSEGSILLGIDQYNFERDGQPGLMLTSIELKFLESSLWKRIKGYWGDDIWLHLEFYQSQDGRYPDQPNVVHRIALDGTPSSSEPLSIPLDIVLRGGLHESRQYQTIYPRAFNRTLLIGDITGDGLADLLAEWTFEQIRFFPGVSGPGLFTAESRNLAIDLPNDGEYAWLVDLNKDGKQDILLHHPFSLKDPHGAPTQPPGTEPHRVTTLIAR